MYKRIFIILFYCLIFNQSNADDLMKALSDAYYKNPELNAERENILVSKEDLKISRSEFYHQSQLQDLKVNKLQIN